MAGPGTVGNDAFHPAAAMPAGNITTRLQPLLGTMVSRPQCFFYIGSDWCSCHGSVTGRHSGDRWGGVTSKVQLKPESRRYCGSRSRRRNGRESTEGGAGQDSSIPLQVPEAAHTGPFPHMGNVGVSLQHILCDHVVAEESLHTGVVPGNVLCLTQIRKSSA